MVRTRAAVFVAAAALGGLLSADAAAIPPVVGYGPPDTDPISGTGFIHPQNHMFGDTIRARIQLIVERNRVNPASLDVDADFAPYRLLEPAEVTRTDVGKKTWLVYDYVLACVTKRCVRPGAGHLELAQAEINYKQRGVANAKAYTIAWPRLRVVARIDPTRLEFAEPRAEARSLPAVSYRISPRTLSIVAAALAVVFALAAVALLLRLLPLHRLAAHLGFRVRPRGTPLERALALVREAERSGTPEEGRRALERLAVELRRSRSPGLAHAASRLAWSHERPVGAGVARLSDDVEQMISANGH